MGIRDQGSGIGCRSLVAGSWSQVAGSWSLAAGGWSPVARGWSLMTDYCLLSTVYSLLFAVYSKLATDHAIIHGNRLPRRTLPAEAGRLRQAQGAPLGDFVRVGQ